MEIKLVWGGDGEGWITILVREYTSLKWRVPKHRAGVRPHHGTSA